MCVLAPPSVVDSGLEHDGGALGVCDAPKGELIGCGEGTAANRTARIGRRVGEDNREPKRHTNTQTHKQFDTLRG